MGGGRARDFIPALPPRPPPNPQKGPGKAGPFKSPFRKGEGINQKPKTENRKPEFV